MFDYFKYNLYFIDWAINNLNLINLININKKVYEIYVLWNHKIFNFFFGKLHF